MSATMVAGWIVVDCDAPSAEVVTIGVESAGGTVWFPAFRDAIDGRRVAKVRPPEVTPGSVITVWLNVAGTTTKAGTQRV